MDGASALDAASKMSRNVTKRLEVPREYVLTRPRLVARCRWWYFKPLNFAPSLRGRSLSSSATGLVFVMLSSRSCRHWGARRTWSWQPRYQATEGPSGVTRVRVAAGYRLRPPQQAPSSNDRISLVCMSRITHCASYLGFALQPIAARNHSEFARISSPPNVSRLPSSIAFSWDWGGPRRPIFAPRDEPSSRRRVMTPGHHRLSIYCSWCSRKRSSISEDSVAHALVLDGRWRGVSGRRRAMTAERSTAPTAGEEYAPACAGVRVARASTLPGGTPHQ